LTIDPVAERDVFERDLAADCRQRSLARRIDRLRPGIENISQSRHREPGLVEVLPNLGKPQHRRADPAGQDIESDELADGEVAIDDKPGAVIKHPCRHQLVDELDKLACRVGETENLEARGDVGGELILPAALHLRLDRHRLERLHATDALHQKRLGLGTSLEFFVEPTPEQRRRDDRNADIEREGCEHQERQERRVGVHHHQKDECEEQIDDEGKGGAGEEIADVFELAHASDRIADATRLEIADRQRQQVAEQASAKLHVDTVRGVGKYICPQDGEDRLAPPAAHQTDDEHVEGTEAAVNEDFVDDDLEKQRRDQCEQLKKERRHQHVAKYATVLVNGTEKPGDVEAARQVDETAAARHQHQLTVPHRLELGARHQG